MNLTTFTFFFFQIVTFSLQMAESLCSPSLITIKGHETVQHLPKSLVNNWKTWTYRTVSGELVSVENPIDDGDGWVNPTTFDRLFLPSDLPIPDMKLALGVAINNGSPRYIMPSIILTLSTDTKKSWRNRGMFSLPRSDVWIDMFAAYAPPTKSLFLSYFGRDVRKSTIEGDPASNFLNGDYWTELNPLSSIGIHDTFIAFQEKMSNEDFDCLKKGFHFVDIEIDTVDLTISLPEIGLQAYLTDFPEPKRLLEFDIASLDVEPCGHFAIEMLRVDAGSRSEYLPEVYKNLYSFGKPVS